MQRRPGEARNTLFPTLKLKKKGRNFQPKKKKNLLVRKKKSSNNQKRILEQWLTAKSLQLNRFVSESDSSLLTWVMQGKLPVLNLSFLVCEMALIMSTL